MQHLRHYSAMLTCLEVRNERGIFRFSAAKVRQAGTVHQEALEVRLIKGKRHLVQSFCISGDIVGDLDSAKRALDSIRGSVDFLPEDPYLNLAEGKAEEITATKT